MKCIVYISRVADNQSKTLIPPGLSEIFRVSRENNRENGITGMLSCRNGYFIQAIEGPDISVNQLLTKLKSDTRHQGMDVILDLFIRERYFKKWSMKLVDAVNKDECFDELMQRNSAAVSKLDSSQKQLLGLFYDIKKSPSSVSRAYDGKDLMLKAWPDLMLMKPSPVIIELCARLTKQAHSYNTLLESKDFGTKQQLDKILNKFETFEILKVMESEQPNQAVIKKKNSNFYSKMKNFLGI